jgi:hypothetical protein
MRAPCSQRNRSRHTRRRAPARFGGSLPEFGEALEPRLLLAAEVLTYHNDNLRTGANLNETILNPGNVNAVDFGKVGQVAVDGAVYAQPLYKASVAIPGQGTHNVVFVATENDSVYAFDADTLSLLWHDTFINPAIGITPVSSLDVKSDVIGPEIGITGTPVIDPATSTLYVVDTIKVIFGAKAFYFQQLQALDLATGAEKLGGPVNIEATVPGRGEGSFRGRVSFNPGIQLQRTGLLLDNGVVYFAFASYGDNGPYHGWIFGYSAQDLHQVAVFNATPNGSDGGIWMSGDGISADASHNLYAVTGNGTFDANQKGKDYGDSVFKFSAKSRLRPVDYFAPSNQKYLSSNDLDLGSGGILLLPDQPGLHPHLLLAEGKAGTLYLINRDNLGGLSRKQDRVVQEIPQANGGEFSTPAYFNGVVYMVNLAIAGISDGSGGGVLEAYQMINGILFPQPVLGGIGYGYPGSTPSISANGTADGIVWTLDNGGFSSFSPAVLRAYDAANITNELYDSTQAGARDQAGAAVKFTVPTVVNGKVYVGGFGTLTVYGLLPQP